MLRDILKDEHKEVVEAELKAEADERKRKAEQNRKAYPVTAQIVDDFRKAGFNTVKVLKTSEIREV